VKRSAFAFLPLLLLTTPLTGYAFEQLIPAGSLIQCTVSEPKLSSKTEDIGDPILCQVSHVELYGRSVLPYGSYLVGRFEDYKDPGHLWGKGWVELKFDRLETQNGQIIPVSAKVVAVPKYSVDKQGDIHGKGHAVRDTVEWAIPVLWPIDLINLPRRGPRPTLKSETRLTVKVMDDIGIPVDNQQASSNYYPPNNYPPVNRDPYGFTQRAPMSYQQPAPPAPVYQPMNYTYVAPPPPVTILMLRTGYRRIATRYWVEGGVQMRYVGTNGVPVLIPMDQLDIPATVAVNYNRGVTFAMPMAGY
jgi:hypothetical protein